MDDELWRPALAKRRFEPPVPIDGYEVSNLGRVRSPNGVLTLQWNGSNKETRNRYRTILIRKRLYSVARLVLLTFRGIPEISTWMAKHLNGDHDDCRLENLEWAFRPHPKVKRYG